MSNETKNILLVCTGNVCRSPMAWGIFQKGLSERAGASNANVRVNSAGLHALVGESAVKEAQSAMREVDVDISSHCAKQITEEIIASSDLVLTMEKHHVKELSFLFPYSRGKIFLLGEWGGRYEIPDPYRKSLDYFINVRKMIEQSFQEWQNKL